MIEGLNTSLWSTLDSEEPSYMRKTVIRRSVFWYSEQVHVFKSPDSLSEDGGKINWRSSQWHEGNLSKLPPCPWLSQKSLFFKLDRKQ